MASLLLIALHLLGTIGYHLIEGWPWLDGLYMTFITLATIGFSEIHPLSTGGRFFTILIAILGIGTVAFIATRSAQLLLSAETFRQKHILRRIKRLKNHFILCGYGRIGQRIAQDLERADRPFVVIELDEQKVEALAKTPYLYLHGNAEMEETLIEAGVQKASGLILLLPEDSANVFVSLVGREINPNLFILARTDQQRNVRKLLHAGVDKVISPYEIGADRMAQVILRPNVDRFMEQILHTGTMALQVDEVLVEPGSLLAGKSLAESNFRQRFDAVVVALIHAGSDEMSFNPGPQIKIGGGDILIVLGNKEMITALRDHGCAA
jgi:voltage-gated potassium channel